MQNLSLVEPILRSKLAKCKPSYSPVLMYSKISIQVGFSNYSVQLLFIERDYNLSRFNKNIGKKY